VFGGKREVNLARVLEKLGAKFGIKRLLLEGGGKINGTLLAADLIDELSVLIAPVADGSVGSPSLFDVGAKSKARPFKLLSVEQRPGDLAWLRYRRAR
jgi:riboflavin biosynthesis pyrimidine reductase